MSCSKQNYWQRESHYDKFQREVIVHELSHLKVLNHGQLFRAFLAAQLANAWKDMNGETAIILV